MPVIANGGWYGAPGVTAAGAYGATPADMLYNLRNQGWSDQQIMDTYGPDDPMVRIMQLENQWNQTRPNTGGYRYQYPSQRRTATPSRAASATQQGQQRTSGQTRPNQSRTVADPGMLAAHSGATDPGMMAAHGSSTISPSARTTDPGMMAAHSGATALPASPVEGYRPTPEIVDAVRNTQAALGTLQTVIANGLNGLGTPPSSAGYAPTQEVADLVRNVRMPSMPDFGGTVDSVGTALATPPSSAGYAPTQEVADLVRNVRMPDFGGTADAVGTALATPPSSAGYAPTQEVADLVRNVRMPDFGGTVDAVGTALATPPSSAVYAPTQEVADLVRNVRMPSMPDFGGTVDAVGTALATPPSSAGYAPTQEVADLVRNVRMPSRPSMPSMPDLGGAADYIGATFVTPPSPAGYEPTQEVADLVRGTRVPSMYAPTAQPPFTPGLTWVPAPASPVPSAVSTPSVQLRPLDQVAQGALPSVQNSPYTSGIMRAQEAFPVVPPTPTTMEDLKVLIADSLRPYASDFGTAAAYAGNAVQGIVNDALSAYASNSGYAPTPDIADLVRGTRTYSMYAPTAQPPFVAGPAWVPMYAQ